MTGNIYQGKPLIWVKVRDFHGNERDFLALVDTGYTRGLCIPLADIKKDFPLTSVSVRRKVEVANGAVIESESFELEILSPSGEWCSVLADSIGDEAIVGMEYIKDNILIIDTTKPTQNEKVAVLFENAVFLDGPSIIQAIRYLFRKSFRY